MVSRFGKDMHRTMNEDQFCQVVDAILNGKYSWACLLILQFAGYNPLHYIPYRTYNRLMKENGPAKSSKQRPQSGNQQQTLAVDNLPHFHTLDSQSNRVRGGYGICENYPLHNISDILSRWN